MTRAATGDTVVVRPTNNIYTVLVIAATIAVAIALGMLIYQAREQGLNLF